MFVFTSQLILNHLDSFEMSVPALTSVQQVAAWFLRFVFEGAGPRDSVQLLHGRELWFINYEDPEGSMMIGYFE